MDPVRIEPSREPRRAPEGCAFSAWLWRQRRRPDPVGQLANVVAHDPFWRGAERREDAVSHLARYGVNPQVQGVMARAWGEYEARLVHDARRTAAKRQRRQSKASRRANRSKR